MVVYLSFGIMHEDFDNSMTQRKLDGIKLLDIIGFVGQTKYILTTNLKFSCFFINIFMPFRCRKLSLSFFLTPHFLRYLDIFIY